MITKSLQKTSSRTLIEPENRRFSASEICDPGSMPLIAPLLEWIPDSAVLLPIPPELEITGFRDDKGKLLT